MPYWLADKRRGQHTSWLQRFDPRFWTVNFPRPMMASVVTTAPDAVRVDAVFYHSDELAGLIWDSQDSLDHPLLGYATSRDYAHTRLSFRWRSSGLKPLDAVHGPTLTVEGRDAGGNPRAWFVRLWNYAAGSPGDAVVTLDFSALDGGFLLPGEADPVYPGDIDRMFISLVSPGYDPVSGQPGTAFAAPQTGWAELTEIRCEGDGAMLEIGDVLVPPHGVSMATAYDDSFNQTPERLLRSLGGLGYRGPINHYVGMSHYFRLDPAAGHEVTLLGAGAGGGALNTPCAAWHRDYLERAALRGQDVILSLSYELFDAHCPTAWKQRAENGDPALTGWEPPSTLLSPANTDAMAYLRSVGRAFAALAVAAGAPVRFQIGEPWWWLMADGRLCLYDDAAVAAFGPDLASIPDIHAPLDAAQTAMLDRAGELLVASTAALADAVRDEAGAAGAELLLLVYLPTVLDASAPDLVRANVPLGWASPAFDVLQLEDYDWVTDGKVASQAQGLAAMTARLGYPVAEQHYFSGFVLRPDEAGEWQRIAASAERAVARGTAATFIWALPQVARDGFTFFTLAPDGMEQDMQAFDDVLFPIAIGQEAAVVPAFSTDIVTTLSGHERRNSQWSDARLEYDAGPGLRSEAELARLSAFFRARRGAARGFRFRDPLDSSSAALGSVPGPADQFLGTGDGVQTRFELVKLYGADELDGEDSQRRRITRPVTNSVRVAVDGIEAISSEASGWTLGEKGVVNFAAPPAVGAAITAGFDFDVPVRFASDRLELGGAGFAAGDIPSVPLVEVREDV